MMELLLAMSCISAKGCEQVRYTYMHYNPQMKEYIKSTEKKAEQYVPKVFIPVAAALVNREIKIPVTKNITLAYKDNTYSTALVYGLEY